MNQRGKLVILLMFTTALVMAGFAWWHQYQGGRHCAEFWGTQPMVIVRYAPRTEFLALAPASKSNSPDTDAAKERILIEGSEYDVIRKRDISKLPGLVHARHALVDDASFEWDHPANSCATRWQFALRFSDRAEQATVAIDPECRQILWLEGNRRAVLVPTIATAFHKKRDDWMNTGDSR